MNMRFSRKLPVPLEIKRQFPVPPELAALKQRRDRLMADIILGRSDRFAVIIGPCSADRRDAVMEYLERLARVAERVSERLLIIPRLYTNKPRTSGDGYMGMLHQPDPQGEPDLLRGIIAIRSLHLDALTRFGFTCADELLYPDNYRYLSDLLSYTAVGARSVEDQYHRLCASGLDIPVGMKNPMYGDLSVMLNSICAAYKPHAFIYRGWEVTTDGDPLTHAVLRGYIAPDGTPAPNYSYDDLRRLCGLFGSEPYSMLNPAAIVDTNHSNSAKDHLRQPEIALDVMRSRRADADIRRLVRGLMIESYLVDGVCDPAAPEYGRSITDPCLGWEKTERLLLDLADAV